MNTYAHAPPNSELAVVSGSDDGWQTRGRYASSASQTVDESHGCSSTLVSVSSEDEPIADIAALVDVVAAESRHSWQVGQELTKRWTLGERTMSAREAVIARSFQFELDAARPSDNPFRGWWLDGDRMEQFDNDSAAICSAVASQLSNPRAAAHLFDLLWVQRLGVRPVESATAACDLYSSAAELESEDRSAMRLLLRSLALATEINDAERRTTAEVAAIEVLERLVGGEDRVAGVWSLRRLAELKLASDNATRLEKLLELAWGRAGNGHETEALGRMLISRTDDAERRQSIAGQMIAAFRSDADAATGMGKLVALREALRVAEQTGHPSRSDVLHEIETMDTEDCFERVGFEQTIPRSQVSDFCAFVVGADSLQMALSRLVAHLPVTPEAVAAVREATPVGIRHTIQRQQIGEANSVVTSSEQGDGSIEAAVDREVRQQTGFQGQLVAFMYLGPALHQVLATYHPWSVGELTEWIEGDTCDAVVASAIVRSLEHFHDRRYDEVVHLMVPRLERQIRQIARGCGLPTTRRPTARVGGVRGLGEVVADLRAGREGNAPLLPEPLITSAELLLVDPDSLNLRNQFAHGISDFGEAWQATLLLQFSLAIALTIELTSASAE